MGKTLMDLPDEILLSVVAFAVDTLGDFLRIATTCRYFRCTLIHDECGMPGMSSGIRSEVLGKCVRSKCLGAQSRASALSASRSLLPRGDRAVKVYVEYVGASWATLRALIEFSKSLSDWGRRSAPPFLPDEMAEERWQRRRFYEEILLLLLVMLLVGLYVLGMVSYFAPVAFCLWSLPPTFSLLLGIAQLALIDLKVTQFFLEKGKSMNYAGSANWDALKWPRMLYHVCWRQHYQPRYKRSFQNDHDRVFFSVYLAAILWCFTGVIVWLLERLDGFSTVFGQRWIFVVSLRLLVMNFRRTTRRKPTFMLSEQVFLMVLVSLFVKRPWSYPLGAWLGIVSVAAFFMRHFDLGRLRPKKKSKVIRAWCCTYTRRPCISFSESLKSSMALAMSSLMVLEVPWFVFWAPLVFWIVWSRVFRSGWARLTWAVIRGRLLCLWKFAREGVSLVDVLKGIPPPSQAGNRPLTRAVDYESR